MRSATTYHLKGKKGVELDEAVEISEEDRYWQEHHIAWVSEEQSHKLHNLGEREHEDELGPKGSASVHWIPIRGRTPAGVEDERVRKPGD